MRYNVNYRGALWFKDPLNELDKILDEDVRDHKEWNVPEGANCTYIDWEKENNALVHNGAEKSYDGANQLRVILLNTQAVELCGVIRYTDDYGSAGIINCTGRDVEERVLVQG